MKEKKSGKWKVTWEEKTFSFSFLQRLWRWW